MRDIATIFCKFATPFSIENIQKGFLKLINLEETECDKQFHTYSIRF